MKNDDDLVNDLYLYTCEKKKKLKQQQQQNTVKRTHRSDKKAKSKINQVHTIETHTHTPTIKRNQAYYKTIILSVSFVVVDRSMVFCCEKNKPMRASHSVSLSKPTYYVTEIRVCMFKRNFHANCKYYFLDGNLAHSTYSTSSMKSQMTFYSIITGTYV